MKRLVAGPWVGEFGWELMSWQGYVRQRAQDFDEVIICAEETHRAIYSDFCTRFIAFDPAEGCRDCWRRQGLNLAELHSFERRLKTYADTQLLPFGLIQLKQQKFIKFGTKDKSKHYDLLVHARKPISHPERSWPLKDWSQLIELLRPYNLSIAAIGTEAYLPEGVADLRSIDLALLMDVMASSSFIVGPSSGPLHLASLCGLPQVVWTPSAKCMSIHATNRQRYENLWNPLNTPCIVQDKYGWEPEVAQVRKLIEEALTRWV